ncbi:MAG: OmpH family outer membrane protein [Candidatus Magnetoovum sp. WYHC-5]|nr:OmpH family outer membrane protein [Candidatus Magnetoovum sp. WYHC-5]
MKKLIVFVAAFAVLFAFSFSRAESEDLKIGFVDVQKVLNESTKGKRAKADLEQFIKSKQSSIDSKTKEIEGKRDTLKKKATALSDSAKKTEEDDLRKLVSDFRRVASDAQEEVRKKETELTSGILTEIKDIITAIAKDEGYTYILESGMLLYASDKVDLTDKVIKKVNSGN